MRISSVGPVVAGLVGLLFFPGAESFCKASTIYNVDLTVGSAVATGDVITDGTIGVLGSGNIVDWDITLTDGTNTAALTGPLSGNDSLFYIAGPYLSATANELQFNFGPRSGLYYAFFQTNASPISFVCFTSDATTCASVAPGQVGIEVEGTNYGETFTGIQTIATTAPEPGGGVLLAVGLAGLWSRKRARFA